MSTMTTSTSATENRSPKTFPPYEGLTGRGLSNRRQMDRRPRHSTRAAFLAPSPVGEGWGEGRVAPTAQIELIAARATGGGFRCRSPLTPARELSATEARKSRRLSVPLAPRPQPATSSATEARISRRLSVPLAPHPSPRVIRHRSSYISEAFGAARPSPQPSPTGEGARPLLCCGAARDPSVPFKKNPPRELRKGGKIAPSVNQSVRCRRQKGRISHVEFQ